MMYSQDGILKDVRICLDNNYVSDSLIKADDIETLSLDEIILSKIEVAIKTVCLNAPTERLGTGEVIKNDVYLNEDGSGYLLLPKDFLRLINFKMSDWDNALYTAFSPNEPLYKRQRSRFKGIRGNQNKPVCFIIPSPIGLKLEFFSSYGFVQEANYISLPKLRNGGYEIPEKCYDSVVYYIAGLTASSYQSKEQAETMFKISNDLLL